MKKTYLILSLIILFILSVVEGSLSFGTPVLATSIKKLPVPFTVQAPKSIWSQPWQDACEESAISMVDYFYSNKKFTPDTAEKSIIEIINTKNNYIGKSLDEDAKTIIAIINGFFSWEAYIQKNPTLEQIKAEIDNGRPIIMPIHGKYLYNPYFRNGGPDYHSIVISGYDDDKQEFITQEPGTRRGLDFRYSYGIIMNAMHDFMPGLQTKFGEKIAIFTNNSIDKSADTDADKDGLSKIEEIQQKTFLNKADSDGDGYIDSIEIKSGYPPTSKIKRKKLIGTLIKAVNDSKVFLIESGLKRHIINETVFLQNGWMWLQILPVTPDFLNNLQTGEQIAE